MNLDLQILAPGNELSCDILEAGHMPDLIRDVLLVRMLFEEEIEQV